MEHFIYTGRRLMEEVLKNTQENNSESGDADSDSNDEEEKQ